MIRVRHYTRVSSMRKIIAEQRLRARDQDKVFLERAEARKLPPADAEEKYGLLPGRGNAYIEFDVAEDELYHRYNPAMRVEEWYVEGSVDLTSRNAEARFNF